MLRVTNFLISALVVIFDEKNHELQRKKLITGGAVPQTHEGSLWTPFGLLNHVDYVFVEET